MSRILALDIGTKRIGLAITDESKVISQPLPYTLSPEELIVGIEDIKREHSIEKIIVGLPKTLAGAEGAQALWVRKMGESMREALKIPVEYFDERLTTKQAAGLESRNLGIPIDALAAQQLLEQYIQKHEARNPKHETNSNE